MACTTGCCGKNATISSSPMVFHSDDSELGDASITNVPRRKSKKGSFRNIYPSAVALGDMPTYNAFSTPRLNVKDRGLQNDFGPQYPITSAIGFIPEVEETYSYVDGSYAICNEHGLAFGECTNGTIFQCYPWDDEAGLGPVKRLFYSSELSRVAAERCKTCREAVALMGYLIDNYGYYGTGECLPIADKNEAWVFEMAPGKDGIGGYWVAKRVPDDEVFFAGNEFRIREVYSKNIPSHKVDVYRGFIDIILDKSRDEWVGEKLFVDFGELDANGNYNVNCLDALKCYSNGEYNHPFYSLRIVWYA
jgi:dipeptidase